MQSLVHLPVNLISCMERDAAYDLQKTSVLMCLSPSAAEAQPSCAPPPTHTLR